MRLPRPHRVARKAVEASETLDVREDEEALEAVEVAIAENRDLRVGLEQIVGDLEQRLVPLLERAAEEAREPRH